MGSRKKRKTLTPFEKSSLIVGSLGAIFGIPAIILSIITYNQTERIAERQVELETELRQSKIVIQIECDSKQSTVQFTKLRYRDGEYTVSYKQNYNIIINNLGYVDASITAWDVQLEVKSMIDSTKVAYGKFEGMEPSFYYEGKSVSLPISISPNKPQKITLEVGVMIRETAWEATNGELQFNGVYDYQKAEDIFMRAGYPFFGQLDRVTGGFNDEGHLQRYFLIITKGDGKELSATFFHNLNSFLIQGEVSEPHL